MEELENVTILLKRASEGDSEAANALFRLVESDLKRIAGKRKQGVDQGIDASTTFLVDEAFCRVLGQTPANWDQGGRRHFYAFVAKTIEWLLLDLIKTRDRQKREGNHQRADNWDFQATPASLRDNPDILIDLQAKLDEFGQFAPEDAMVFRFRFFLGCTFEEIAEILALSPTSTKRSFQQAKLWLQKELRDYHDDA